MRKPIRRGTRIVVAFIGLILVVVIVEPHTMDVNPPRLVKVLLLPTALVAPSVLRLLPHGNIGTAEHPIIEGTPLDFLAAEILILLNILLYPVAVYLLLTLLSRVMVHKS